MAMPEKLTWDERQAWPVIRNLIQRRPEVVPHLIQGTTKEMAVRVLESARDELTHMLEVNRAFSAACAEIAKLEKSNEPSQPDC